MMSFILDALKKSEQQRQEGQNGPRQVRKKTLAFGETRRARWPFRLLIVVLLLGGVGAGWFWLSSHEEQVAVDVTPAPTPTEDPTQPVVSKPEVEPVPQKTPATESPEPKEPVETASKTLSTPATDAPERTVPVEAAPVPRPFTKTVEQVPAASRPARTAQEEQPRIATERFDGETAAPPASDAVEPSARQQPLNVMTRYSDLSPELRSRLPEMAMSMHFYTDNPARRLVRINGRLLHEGDQIDSNLELLEVTPDGAIFDFLGKTFLLRSGPRQ